MTEPGNELPTASELPLLVDGQDRTLHLELLRCLRSDAFDRIDLIVSFIMKSGLAMIAGPLEDAIDRGARTRILTTDYLEITDADALARLLDLVDTWVTRSLCACSATRRRASTPRPTCSGRRRGRQHGLSSGAAT
jgi:HKD family nuclease